VLTVAGPLTIPTVSKCANRQRQGSVNHFDFNEQPFLLTMLTVLTIYSDLFLPAVIGSARLEAHAMRKVGAATVSTVSAWRVGIYLLQQQLIAR